MDKIDPTEKFDTSIKTFVLRAGRITDTQKRALEQLSERYIIPFDTSYTLDFQNIFQNNNPTIVELGFGMGLATWQIALNNPQNNYIGLEVYKPGIGKLLAEIEEHKISNLRIISHDAVEVFEKMLAPESLAGLHIFYPDPWPKKRHHKRRLIRPGIIEILASRLKKDAYLYFVTDIEDYAHWALSYLSLTSSLKNTYDTFAPHQTWRPETKFEKRALENEGQAYELFFRKA